MAYAIRELTKNLYVAAISNGDVSLDTASHRVIFDKKADAEDVIFFCNAAINDSFTLAEEQEVTVCVSVKGTATYYLSENIIDRESALDEAEFAFSCIDFCDMDVIDWDVDVSAGLEKAMFDVTGEVLITGLTPDINDIGSIIYAAEYRASKMDFGLLENVRLLVSNIEDANGNRVYEA